MNRRGEQAGFLVIHKVDVWPCIQSAFDARNSRRYAKILARLRISLNPATRFT